MEMLKTAAGVDIVHIPYKGSAPAVTDLLGGQRAGSRSSCRATCCRTCSRGKIRLLASTGRKRFASTPNAPTMIESGFPDFEAVAWIGVLTTGGTPRPIIERYHRELGEDLRAARGARQAARRSSSKIVAGTPEQFGEWIRMGDSALGKSDQADGREGRRLAMTRPMQRPFRIPRSTSDKKRLELIKGYRVHEQRTPSQARAVVDAVADGWARSSARGADPARRRRSRLQSPGGARAEGTPIVVGGQRADEAGSPVRRRADRSLGGELPRQVRPSGRRDTSSRLDPNFKALRPRADARRTAATASARSSPAPIPNPGYDDWMRPPHIHFSVFARRRHAAPDHADVFPRRGAERHRSDPQRHRGPRCARVADRARSWPVGRSYRFDIVLRGKAETAFLRRSLSAFG